uniref:Sugar transporter SWEET n=1 Tax=Timema bartmani TaxID=61472 RepID=A0A7R9EZ18_9NEOP|nr:unnamed protein product [Timema bartmani]
MKSLDYRIGWYGHVIKWADEYGSGQFQRLASSNSVHIHHTPILDRSSKALCSTEKTKTKRLITRPSNQSPRQLLHPNNGSLVHQGDYDFGAGRFIIKRPNILVTRCSLWLRYGFFIRDNSLILVNTFGASLQLAYVITYYLYCVKKSLVCRQMFTACTVLVVTLAYSEYETDLLVAKYRVGLLCCFVTIIFFAAPLTMLAHVIRVKSAETLPFSLILATFVVSAQWFLYGFLLNDFFIQVPNALGTALSAFQLSLFVIYRSDSSATSPLIQIR